MDLIAGVRTKKLKVIPDARGRLMEMYRSDEDLFVGFGQVYLTTTLPGVVKAWHLHKLQTDNIVCVQGMIRLGLYDGREDSPTYGLTSEFFLGVHGPRLVQVPPLVHHGWKCVSLEEALIINTVTEPYNPDRPDEFRLDPHDNHLPWNWDHADG